MDLFDFYQPYQVLICRDCQHCVHPSLSALTTHLRAKHRLHPDVRPRDGKGRAASVARLLCKAFPAALDPTKSPILYPAPTTPAIPGLLLQQGLKCSQCPKIVTASPCAENTMSKHFQKHRAVRTTRGGRHVPLQHLYENGSLIYTHVYCQRFFATGPQSSYFEVAPKSSESAAVDQPIGQKKAWSEALSREALLHELINAELDSSQRALEANSGVFQGALVATEADPWLDATRWRQLFKGVPLLKAAVLGHMPDLAIEPDLYILTESVDRLVEQAHAAVCDDRIGFFNQFRINSFIDNDATRASKKALIVNLRKETYRAYKYI
jgi:hypothetical protein